RRSVFRDLCARKAPGGSPLRQYDCMYRFTASLAGNAGDCSLPSTNFSSRSACATATVTIEYGQSDDDRRIITGASWKYRFSGKESLPGPWASTDGLSV